MGKRILTFIIIILAVSAHAQTLEECQQAAEKNYPVIKRYDLIGRTTELTVSNLQKEWLPRITASAQATLSECRCCMAREHKKRLSTHGIGHERTEERSVQSGH